MEIEKNADTTQLEKMLAAELYDASDALLVSMRKQAKALTAKFNDESLPGRERKELLDKLFGGIGEGIFVEPPFHCDYGSNIYVGDNFYANYDCIMLDVCRIDIGSDVLIGPRVTLTTATHPISPEGRLSGLESGKPIKVGNNVWLCAGVVITPGVTIGDNSIIAAGAVVTKDVPPNTMAAGVPAKVVKRLD